MSSRHVLLVFFAIVAIFSWIVIFILVDATVRVDLLKQAASTLLQLALIVVLGAYAKYLLDQYSADRQRRETQHQAQIEALNSLTKSYWQIKKAFHIIDAHRSAKSYGKQMRQIIDYRLELQRLNNEIQAGLYALDQVDIDTIKTNLDEMDKRLGEVIDEWKVHYLRLSRLQNQDEATDKPNEKKVPNEIGKLSVLGAIKKDGKYEAIHVPFESAVTPIRDQLKREISLPN
jgi:hypothetical protein